MALRALRYPRGRVARPPLQIMILWWLFVIFTWQIMILSAELHTAPAVCKAG